MNDEDLERGEGVESGHLSEGDRPAVVAYDPYFPARRSPEAAVGERYDPHFPTDGASAFD